MDCYIAHFDHMITLMFVLVNMIIRENNKTIEHQWPRKTADNSISVIMYCKIKDHNICTSQVECIVRNIQFYWMNHLANDIKIEFYLKS